MALISKTTIAEVNSRLDAVSVIGDYVRLEKKSGRWWGRCPFHAGGQEKTPSFKVDPDLKMYHCFGCDTGGSVIGFIMEMEKFSYPEAIKTLARRMGIEIIYEEGGQDESEQGISVKEELYELYRRTTVMFRHFLDKKEEGKIALEYLLNRGINREMIDTFKLGFSPADRNFLHNFLRQKGYSDDFLSKSGLFSANYKTMPLFSGRLMFPITDRQGKIVAFGGRSMPGASQSDGKEPPKYINSPETEIYNKGQTLFAIDTAKPVMRQTKTVYLAEGYMDIVAMHQAGVTNSVAPLGTAFTGEQAAWLRRWVDRVILVFDSDEAGQKAAYRAILICRKNGLSCSLVNMKSQNNENLKDPADILQKFGSDVLNKFLKNIINDFEYLISHGKSQYVEAMGDINGAAEFMYPYLDALDSEITRADSITRIADIFKIDRIAVNKDYSEWKSKGNKDFFEKPENFKKNILQVRRNAELSLLTFVALNLELYPEFRSSLEIREIDDLAAKELFIAMEECYKQDENGIDFLLARIKDESLRHYVSDRGTSGEFSGESRKYMEDGINKIRKKGLERRLLEINAQMRESERYARDFCGFQEENENIDELLTEKKHIDSQIRKLEGK